MTGDYGLVATDEGEKANIHVTAVGATGNERFRLGFNVHLRGNGAGENGGNGGGPPESTVPHPTSARPRTRARLMSRPRRTGATTSRIRRPTAKDPPLRWFTPRSVPANGLEQGSYSASTRPAERRPPSSSGFPPACGSSDEASHSAGELTTGPRGNSGTRSRVGERRGRRTLPRTRSCWRSAGHRRHLYVASAIPGSFRRRTRNFSRRVPPQWPQGPTRSVNSCHDDGRAGRGRLPGRRRGRPTGSHQTCNRCSTGYSTLIPLSAGR